MNKNERIEKYNYLETEFFSTGIDYAYEFKYEGREYTIDYGDDNKVYLYADNEKDNKGPFNNIYEALDGIVLGGKTIRQLLLDTDFNFEAIS